jgi:hypothetical protein
VVECRVTQGGGWIEKHHAHVEVRPPCYADWVIGRETAGQIFQGHAVDVECKHPLASIHGCRDVPIMGFAAVPSYHAVSFGPVMSGSCSSTIFDAPEFRQLGRQYRSVSTYDGV